MTRTADTLLIMSERLVPTGDAAKAIGVGRSTLARWMAEGLVKPALVTPGGHARWDVDDLRKQLDDLRKRDDG
jgi:DNA-binding transcriptional MerR regulator